MVRIPTLLIGDGEFGGRWDTIGSEFKQIMVHAGFYVIGGAPCGYTWSRDIVSSEKVSSDLVGFQMRNFPSDIFRAGCFNVVAAGKACDVVAHAINRGFMVHDLVTVAAPSSRATKNAWAEAAPKIIRKWTHIHTGMGIPTPSNAHAHENIKMRFTKPTNLMDAELWRKMAWSQHLTLGIDLDG